MDIKQFAMLKILKVRWPIYVNLHKTAKDTKSASSILPQHFAPDLLPLHFFKLLKFSSEAGLAAVTATLLCLWFILYNLQVWEIRYFETF